jgi:regulator of protease activity HflC (stomatin/prohibitin superfamily)
MLLLILALLFLWNRIFITIPSGAKGVLWHRFTGTVTNEAFSEGLAVINPIDEMFIYDTRIQNIDDSLKVLTLEGLYTDIFFSFRFHPMRDSVGIIHKLIGPHYADKVVAPEVKAAIISVIGNYTPERLYKVSTMFIQSTIKNLLEKQLYAYNIILDDFLIRKILIPDVIKSAIEKKLATEQLSFEYDYRLDVEQKEKERKQIEAQGVQQFEQISGISILKWRGLEVTSEIAKSENSKVIIIGTGENDLPVILDAK